MNHRYYKRSVGVILFILGCVINVIHGQTEINRVTQGGKASNCEELLYQLDKAMYANSQSENLKLILIFRLGKYESNRRLNEARIKKIQDYLRQKDYLSRAVFAEGFKADGLGTLEIYLKGEMFAELFFVKGNSNSICIE